MKLKVIFLERLVSMVFIWNDYKSLDRQLLIMLGGDKKAALRLLRNARKNNPGKSYLWYHEKVIADLERDRRY